MIYCRTDLSMFISKFIDEICKPSLSAAMLSGPSVSSINFEFTIGQLMLLEYNEVSFAFRTIGCNFLVDCEMVLHDAKQIIPMHITN